MRPAAPSSLPVSGWPPGDVAVVSPHLDDAALSLGCAIAALARAGRKVTVVTPFAGDPDADGPPDAWERRSGFASAEDSARARREEDRRACRLLGAEPVWLPFDARYPDGVEAALLAAVAEAAVVLVPAAPCSHGGHVHATRIILEAKPPGVRIGLYVDEPYAMWRLLGEEREVGSRGRNAISLALRRSATATFVQPRLAPALAELVTEDLDWRAVPPTIRDVVAKQRSIFAYTSQMRVFSPAMPVGIALYEWQWGGEGVAWLG